jgi:capsule biosynthesis phosphatase
LDVIDRVNALHAAGVRIIVYSARNMRTYAGNVGLINKHTLPVLISWLAKHGVRYDEIHMGKPWCGLEGFYVKARSLRPSRFVDLPLDTLQRLIASDQDTDHGRSHGH